VLGAAVGGIVGALVAGGLFVLTDDDGTTTLVRPDSTPVVSRPSSRIDTESDVAAIIGSTEPAIVAITTGDGPGTGTGGAGTGFVITADGFVVTNNHVVDGADRIEVAFTDGSSLEADLVGNDPSSDLAVLKVDGENLPTLELGDSEGAQVGDDVLVIGNALALEGGLTVTQGILSGTDRTVDTNAGGALVGMLQTDAAINPGNSGGPLLDAEAKVIGIATAIANPAESQRVGFAIPASRAKPIIEDLRLGRAAAFLGVSTQNVTPALARELDLGVTDGAHVSRVTEGSPAADAGIQEGDVIVEIDGEPISDSADVQTAVRSRRPGDTVRVVVDRDGERVAVDATLVERPNDS
jgi:S1-C subfamily serine protease